MCATTHYYSSATKLFPIQSVRPSWFLGGLFSSATRLPKRIEAPPPPPSQSADRGSWSKITESFFCYYPQNAARQRRRPPRCCFLNPDRRRVNGHSRCEKYWGMDMDQCRRKTRFTGSTKCTFKIPSERSELSLQSFSLICYVVSGAQKSVKQHKIEGLSESRYARETLENETIFYIFWRILS